MNKDNSKKPNRGRITQIIGAVIDARFEKELPALYNSLQIETDKGPLTLEVQQHLGLKKVRAVAMSSTDGLKRGDEVEDTGAPISVPVGPETLGRMFDVTGIDSSAKFRTGAMLKVKKAAPILKKMITEFQQHDSKVFSIPEGLWAEEAFGMGMSVVNLIWLHGR